MPTEQRRHEKERDAARHAVLATMGGAGTMLLYLSLLDRRTQALPELLITAAVVVLLGLSSWARLCYVERRYRRRVALSRLMAPAQAEAPARR